MASNEVFCMHGFAMKYDTKPVVERENIIYCIIMIHPIALDVQFFSLHIPYGLQQRFSTWDACTPGGTRSVTGGT